jgi:PEP-CTERM motif
MLKTMMISTAAIALLGAATSASAAIGVTFADGNGGLTPGEVVFATFSPGSDGGVSGSGYIVQTGGNGLGADPAVGLQGDPYLSVLGGGTASFAFAAGGVSQLGLDYGSADWYNLFTLSLSDGSTASYTGNDLINAGTADGNQSAPRTNGRLTFRTGTGPSITGLTLSSSQNSLEPATWAMMLVGFGAMGVSMRRRRTGSTAKLMQIA